MQTGISLRPLTQEDGPAFAGLSYSSPDGGSISYAANYRIDAMQAVKALHIHFEGFAVCARDNARMIGAGLIRYGHCQYEGEVRPFALIGNLIVHPDYRGQGLALQLAQRLIKQAREQIGAKGVLVTNYQHGNKISESIFGRFMEPLAGSLTYLPLMTRAAPPPSSPEVLIGPLDEDELPAFAGQLNDFYQEYALYQPLSPQDLAAFCQVSPFRSPIRHAYCVVGADGCLLAGLVALEEYRLKQMEVRSMPSLVRSLNGLLHLIPESGEINEVYIDRLWFKPGYAWAARQLVDMVRWVWHDRASHVSTLFDPRGPLGKVFPTRPWTVMAKSDVAVQGPAKLKPGSLISPIY